MPEVKRETRKAFWSRVEAEGRQEEAKKLYEELFDDRELVESTYHKKIKRAVAGETFPSDSLTRHLTDLQRLCEADRADDRIIEKLREIVSNYRPAFSDAP